MRVRTTWFVAAAAGLAACTPQRDADMGTAEEALTVCPAGTTLEGIDVTTQGTVDWAQVHGAGIEFAFIGATEGETGVYNQFAANWTGALNAGVTRGAFHYFLASLDPVVQADHFVNTVGVLRGGDLPMAIDLEETDGQTAAVTASKAATFIQRVSSVTGRPVILYVSSSFFSSLGSPSSLSSRILWINHKGVTCPDIPSPSFSDWAFWQYGNSAVAGVSGSVSRDKFNGSLADLRALGQPSADAGLVSPDAGAYLPDAGPAPSDAAAVSPDAGTVPAVDASAAVVGPDASAKLATDSGTNAGEPDAGAAPPGSSGGCACSAGVNGAGLAAPALISMLLVLCWLSRRTHGR